MSKRLTKRQQRQKTKHDARVAVNRAQRNTTVARFNPSAVVWSGQPYVVAPGAALGEQFDNNYYYALFPNGRIEYMYASALTYTRIGTDEAGMAIEMQEPGREFIPASELVLRGWSNYSTSPVDAHGVPYPAQDIGGKQWTAFGLSPQSNDHFNDVGFGVAFTIITGAILSAGAAGIIAEMGAGEAIAGEELLAGEEFVGGEDLAAEGGIGGEDIASDMTDFDTEFDAEYDLQESLDDINIDPPEGDSITDTLKKAGKSAIGTTATGVAKGFLKTGGKTRTHDITATVPVAPTAPQGDSGSTKTLLLAAAAVLAAFLS